MTIAAIWQEDKFLWCAADTRLVIGQNDLPTTELASKIYAIQVNASAFGPDGWVRSSHYGTRFGFVYAGSALTATMVASTSSTLLSQLVSAGSRKDPPSFEDIARFIHKISEFFIRERDTRQSDGTFSAGFFGYCPHEQTYKVACIDSRRDGGSLRVELSFPDCPSQDGDPWLTIGSAKESFMASFHSLKSENQTERGLCKKAIQKMISDDDDKTVGGDVSLGICDQDGFNLYWNATTYVSGEADSYRNFNGIDIDRNIGPVGCYIVGGRGMA